MTSVDLSLRSLRIGADRHAFAGELVDHVQHAELPAVMGAVLDKIIGPDAAGVLWSKPHVGSIIQPKTPLLRRFCRTLRPSRRQMR